jgi:hypothetical protein
MTRGVKTILLFGSLATALVVALAVLSTNLRSPRAFRQPLDTSVPGVELKTVFVYYLAADSLGLVPLPREIAITGSRSAFVAHLVTHLTSSSDRTRAPLPPGTRLLHYFETGDGGAVLDLSAEIGTLTASSIEEEEHRLAALVRTVGGNVPGVTRLRLLMEGHPLDRWGGHVRPAPWVEVDSW